MRDADGIVVQPVYIQADYADEIIHKIKSWRKGSLNFIISLELKYVLFTIMMFLTGVLMYCLFNGECWE